MACQELLFGFVLCIGAVEMKFALAAFEDVTVAHAPVSEFGYAILNCWDGFAAGCAGDEGDDEAAALHLADQSFVAGAHGYVGCAGLRVG